LPDSRALWSEKTMSYTLDFVPNTLSSNNPEAFRQLEILRERYYDDESEKHPALVRLHDVLVRRYPCLSSYDDDDPAIDESVWADGPLIENFKSELGMLALSFFKVDEALPFILKTAIDLKINVLDSQTGKITRPTRLNKIKIRLGAF
jgi:hypothetical protein